MYADTDAEFSGERSTNYQDALRIYPEAWHHDLRLMHDMLQPRPGESIVEVGAGTGYFSRESPERSDRTVAWTSLIPRQSRRKGLPRSCRAMSASTTKLQKIWIWRSRVSTLYGAAGPSTMSATKPGRLSDSPRTPNPVGGW